MFGGFAYGGAVYGGSGQFATNDIKGTSTLTAQGQLVGSAPAGGSSTLATIIAQLIGHAAGEGDSTLAVTQARLIASAAGSGSSVLSIIQGFLVAHGITVSGLATLSAAGQLIGKGNGSGTSLLIGYPFQPSYTDWNSESILFLFSGETINESDAAFEQAGRIVLCAEKTVHEQQEVWLYWFDPLVGRFIFEKICLGSNPRVILDDPLNTVTSDVLLFYVTLVEQRICYRQQRDRYLIEYQTPLVKVPHSYIDLYLQDVVKARDGRLVVIGAQRNIPKGQWSYIRLESALYPFVQEPDPFRATQKFLNTSTLTLARIIRSIEIDSFAASSSFRSGSLLALIIFCGPPGTLNPVGAPVPFYDSPDEFKAAQAFTSGIFLQVLFPHTLYDVDAFKADAIVFESGTLVRVVIVMVLYDIDEFKTASTFIAAGSSLV